ncbi:hypothetical protein TBLA_0B02770 [Henningerozyma blattae CBS 6284]|uniref:30 kDa heat shock protein n=1 Tax=Henningerozyma blattae (strain ATCC 34711 / CBS 6284 / DSM 70876 / NBRC 10599 / NRRL Y-10934 / UCD 77-7) TaxID=1071380 RepID=I2GYB7_HENB6|nr:hypothetical protein TBLA_0B02770 [Tetrapisispora blattae CBS 6284]CCH59119.1 hypothetical protein TBLA_0B02770 [Tetrapisispora blattae CBS 6284]
MSSLENGYVNLFKRGNRAVHVNPPTGTDIHLTESGSDWLWTVFSVFGFLGGIYAIMFFYVENKKEYNKLQRYTIAGPFIICIFESFAYYTYASNLGWGGIQAEFRGEDVSHSITNKYPNVRQVFYCKFIGWVLSWPVLYFLNEMASLCVHAGENIDFFFWDIAHSLLVQILGTTYWIVCLLVGILIHSTYKWGYWVMGVFVLLTIEGIKLKRQIVDLKIRGFQLCVFLTHTIIVLLYTVCWGLSEGGNAITPDAEAVFYGILDLCLFAIYPGYLSWIINRYDCLPGINTSLPRPQQTSSEEKRYAGKELPMSPRNSGETAIGDNETEIENSEDEEEPGESSSAAAGDAPSVTV